MIHTTFMEHGGALTVSVRTCCGDFLDGWVSKAIHGDLPIKDLIEQINAGLPPPKMVGTLMTNQHGDVKSDLLVSHYAEGQSAGFFVVIINDVGGVLW